jgi:hypothetical protein
MILVEGDCVRYFTGHFMDVHDHPKLSKSSPRGLVKRGNTLQLQLHAPLLARRRVDSQEVTRQIKLHFKSVRFCIDRPSGEAAGVQVESCLPAMIDPRCQHQPHLAYHLAPEMESINRRPKI